MQTRRVITLVTVVASLALVLGIAVGYSISSPPVAISGVQLYEVTFQQNSCNPSEYVSPWSVKLGNETIVKPSNETVSTSGVVSISPYPDNNTISTITFSVPNGVYNYAVIPSDGFTSTTSGTVKVNGSDLFIQIAVICHP
jgi:hypothetical protein